MWVLKNVNSVIAHVCVFSLSGFIHSWQIIVFLQSAAQLDGCYSHKSGYKSFQTQSKMLSFVRL